jgi:dTMP kinase
VDAAEETTETGRRARGMFITFEGIDGSGKSTQLRLAAAFLRERRVAVLETREPGGTSLGEEVRRLLLDPRRPVTPMAELLLYAASRAQHVAEVVRPALARGEVVLCDRFADATVAYQGGGRGLPHDLLAAVNHVATGGLRPDLTFLFDVGPSVGRSRQAERGRAPDRLEEEAEAFQRRVRTAYLEIARGDPERVVVLDGARPVEDVHEDVRRTVQALLTRMSS